MKRSRTIFTAVFALAGLSVAGAPLHARADEPCVELRYKGKDMLAIPCPGALAEILNLPLFQPKPRDTDEFHIHPDIPDDRDMAIDPEWDEDRDMVVVPDTD